jgi:hypothetical protein
MSKTLGDIKRLDVRTAWEHEAVDFTPWLAKEENLKQLGDELGFELELEGTEVSVGPYAADILALDTSTGDYVVIENQLEKTNHDHLGKLITYAAVLDATAIMWLAQHFTDEHKKALDWLNDNSSDDISYFGVQIELWQIDDSRPALKFNVISHPTDIVRSAIKSSINRPISETKKLQGEFWTAFREELIKSKTLSSARQARPRYWYNIPLGRTGIHISNIADTRENKIGIRVYMRHVYNAEAALSQLIDQKEEIEKEIGETLIWNPNEKARDKTIVIYKQADLRRRDKWPEYLEWFVDMTGKYRKVFMPRIKELDLEFAEEEQEYDNSPSNS